VVGVLEDVQIHLVGVRVAGRHEAGVAGSYLFLLSASA
jgi:hypothetical protein